MAIDFESVPGVPIPGGGPQNPFAPAITVPIATTAVSAMVIARAVVFLGWSLREATGGGNAVFEFIDGGDDNGPSLGVGEIMLGAAEPGTSGVVVGNQSGSNAVQTANLGGVGGQLAVVTKALVDGLGATAGTEVTATLTGTVSPSTINIPVSVPAGVTTPITPRVLDFGDGLPAASVGGTISLTLPAFGAGNTLEQATLIGYTQEVGGGSDTHWLGPSGILARSGVRLRVVSGSVRGCIWARLG